MRPENITLDHDEAVRRVLVRTAGLGTPGRRQPSMRTAALGIVAAVTAFAVAGALTGAAVASASTPNAQQQMIYNANQAAGVGWVVEEDSKLLGQPFTASGTGKLVVNLGERPVGANAIVEASVCSDPGTYNEQVDLDQAQTVCDSTNTGIGNVATGDYPVTKGGKHTYVVTTSPGAHYSVWLSWIYYPTLAPSAAEKAAVSDGTVTREEYIAAFNQYLGCMASAGETLTGYDESTPIIQYTVPAADVNSGIEHRCYVTQFGEVDAMWQTEDGGIHKN
jgi:hypothetical protein